MAWDGLPTALDETELVAVRSNDRPPSELHPESARGTGQNADKRDCLKHFTGNAITHQSTRTQVLNGAETRGLR